MQARTPIAWHPHNVYPRATITAAPADGLSSRFRTPPYESTWPTGSALGWAMWSIGFLFVQVFFVRCEHSERVFKRLLGHEQYADISPTDRQHQMRNHRARNSNLNGVRSWACTAGASLALEDPARSSLSLRRACAATTPFPSPGWDLPGNPNSRPPPRRLRARRPVLPHCCASRSLQLPAQQTSAYPSAAARPANPSPISVRRGLATPSTLRLSPLQYPARCAHDPWAAAPCGTTAAQRRFLARGGPVPRRGRP